MLWNEEEQREIGEGMPRLAIFLLLGVVAPFLGALHYFFIHDQRYKVPVLTFVVAFPIFVMTGATGPADWIETLREIEFF